LGVRVAAAAVTTFAVAAASTATASARTFVVTQAGDPAPGACNANCSLREAVIAANERNGDDVVRLAKRTYRITRDTALEDLGETGDLDVHDDLTIAGRGPRSVIDGEWEPIGDALILAHADVDLALRDLSVRDGESTADYSALALLGPGDLRLTDVRFLSNRARYAAVANFGTARLRRVEFVRNVGTDCCAALFNFFEMRLTDVVFDRNRAGADTGAMYSDGTSAVFNRVTFSRNHAGSVGGALITSTGTNTLRNVTFSGNSSDSAGGALYLEDDATLNNVTMVRNVADADGDDGPDNGGALFNAGGVATISNSIFAGNTDGGDGLNSCGNGAVESAGFNLFGPGFGCLFLTGPGDVEATAGQVGLRSKLRANGGFAPSHAIKRSSAARNKGQNSSCEPRDQRGVKRPQGPRCDIGAYELK
jgi:CSLREA domain-containing protein